MVVVSLVYSGTEACQRIRLGITMFETIVGSAYKEGK